MLESQTSVALAGWKELLLVEAGESLRHVICRVQSWRESDAWFLRTLKTQKGR